MMKALILVILLISGIVLNTAYILGPFERNLISGRAGYPVQECCGGTPGPVVSVILEVGTVDFGLLGNGQEEDTTDFSPVPLEVKNTGNRQADVTIRADDLWDSVPNPSDYFQFLSAEMEAGSVDNPASDLVASFSDIPPDPVSFARNFNFQEARDQLYGHIRVMVPEEEGAGDKESVIVFTASLS